MGATKDVNAALISAASGKVEVATVGRVLSWDRATNTCTVQPLIHGRFLKPDGTTESQARAVLSGVPVAWPATATFSLVGELAEGDEVWLAMAGRSLEEWKAGAVPADGISPADPRRHSLQDCVAIPIVRVLDPDASAGNATVLRATELRLGDATANSGVAKGDAVDANLTALKALLTTLSTAADWTIAAAAIAAFVATPWPATTESDSVLTK